MPAVEVIHADMLEELGRWIVAGRTVHAVVTDPPYGLAFMGRAWDAPENVAFRSGTCRLVFDVLPPGGHVIAFGGTRTFHRLAVAIEEAGFEIRDTLAWLYGSGVPKSLDVSKAIDRAAGAERDVIAKGDPVKRMIPGADQNKAGWQKNNGRLFVPTKTAPATDDAAAWQGWGTALKPAMELIVLARKPLDGTVAANVLAHGTGALNIDACRVAGTNQAGAGSIGFGAAREDGYEKGTGREYTQAGRWPANVLHDGSTEVVEAFPLEAARFFYSPKADVADRLGSKHPTVKPVDLMRWLVRLVTPPRGTVLDPFAGSGSTAMAAMAEGFDAVAIEREAEFAADIRRRVAHVRGHDTPLFGVAP